MMATSVSKHNYIYIFINYNYYNAFSCYDNRNQYNDYNSSDNSWYTAENRKLRPRPGRALCMLAAPCAPREAPKDWNISWAQLGPLSSKPMDPKTYTMESSTLVPDKDPIAVGKSRDWSRKLHCQARMNEINPCSIVGAHWLIYPLITFCGYCNRTNIWIGQNITMSFLKKNQKGIKPKKWRKKK